MTRLTFAQIQKRREERYRLRKTLRLKDADDIRHFVNEVGVCLLFPVQNVEMPNVYQAVAGYAKDMTPKHDDPAISLTWNTKDRSLDKRWWYYGKLLRNKATLVSLDLLPAFYALSENFGEEDDYLHEYQAGTLSADAKNIYEALLKNGAMHAIELKRKSNLYGDELKSKFDKALNELQTGLKVLPVGVAEAGAWRYAFIYEIVSRWFPDVPIHARNITPSDARSRLVTNYLSNVIFATPKAISSVFGWKVKETQVVIEKLANQGLISFGRLVKGLSEDVIVMNLNDK
jgi:hypothetical protein